MKRMHVVDYTLPFAIANVSEDIPVKQDEVLYGWGDDRYLHLVEIHNAHFWHCSDHVGLTLVEGNFVVVSMACHPLLRQSVVVKELKEPIYEPWVESAVCYDNDHHAIGTRIICRASYAGQTEREIIFDVLVSFGEKFD